MNKLELMKIFTAVCELESFTLAAHTLNLPKASISTSVQKLETLLGTRLLHRTTRKVTITQDGLAVYEQAKDLLLSVEDLEGRFQNQTTELRGRLRVDFPLNVARKIIIPRLPDFLAKHPGIEVELGSTDRRVDLIREGFDFVIRVGNLTDSGLIAKKIGSYDMINCVSPSYVERYGKPRKLEDLKDHYLINYVSNLGSRPEGFEYFDGKQYVSRKMRSLITVNNSDAYEQACLTGLGIIQVPWVLRQTLIKRGELLEILPKLTAEPMPISIVYPNRKNLSKRVRVFMDWVEAQVLEFLT